MRITGRYVVWYREVKIDGRVLSPADSQSVFNHSPDGFAWGYGGSGPAQLALAILLAAGVPESSALALHQEFKRRFIEPLPIRDFDLSIDIGEWLSTQIRQVCQFCRQPYGWKPGAGRSGDSHGICATCDELPDDEQMRVYRDAIAAQRNGSLRPRAPLAGGLSRSNRCSGLTYQAADRSMN
jgi:hypothetical protein